jgi:hypothetical protein
MEEITSLGSRSSARVQALTREIAAMAKGEHIKVGRYSRKQLNLALISNVSGTKHALAEYLAARFPEELSFRLPPKRRLWMNKDYRMGIFDAVALAHYFLRSRNGANQAHL